MKNRFFITMFFLFATLFLVSCGQSSVAQGGHQGNPASSGSGIDSNSSGQVKAPLTPRESLFKNGPVCVQDFSGLWGYIDVNGDYMIEPKFPFAFAFTSNNLAVVQGENGLWGYIDVNGNYAIEPQYQSAASFSSNGLAAVQDPDTSLYGYINSSGTYVIDPKLYVAKPFAQDLAFVRDDDGGKYIDTQGNCRIALPGFHDGTSFSNDRAFVCDYTANDDYGGYAMIDLDGNLLTDTIFSRSALEEGGTAFWSDGLCRVDNRFINEKGEVIAPKDGGSFAGLGYFHDGYVYVYDNESSLWGYIDTNGSWVIPPQFSQTTNFYDESAAVMVPDLNLGGIIDINGNWLVEPQFNQIDDSYGKYFAEIDGHYLLIDKHGNILHEYEFEGVSRVSIYADVLIANNSGHYQMYDLSGLPIEGGAFDRYRSIVTSESGFERAEVQYNECWGLIDGSGDWLIPARFMDFKIR